MPLLRGPQAVHATTHPDDNHKLFHHKHDEDLEQSIADLNTAIRKPDLVVLEAMEILTDGGPLGPGPVAMAFDNRRHGMRILAAWPQNPSSSSGGGEKRAFVRWQPPRTVILKIASAG